MGRNIPLGRIAGIKISMDLTVLLLAAFYTFTLAQNRFPSEAPDLSSTAYWVAGVAGALLFFVSLLVHEMGHALVAKDEGIGVRGVSLWLLGGMARLESAPTSARSEFRIAVVGPLASAACGIVFLCTAYVLPEHGQYGLAGNVFALLGRINLLLAVFNLLPAAPLDGGTVLASAIWKRTGSQAKGMKWSAIVGLAVGAALIFGGARMATSDGATEVNGWSLVFVGAFIGYAAFRSMQAQPLYAVLDGAVVADAMEPRPPVARGTVTVGDFLRSLGPEVTAQAYPVVDTRGQVTGLLTADAIRAAGPDQWDRLQVDHLAFGLDKITVVSTTDALLPAVQRIDGGDVRDGLVVGPDGTVAGIIDARALYRVAEQRRAALATAAR